MTNVLTVPPSLDESTFELLAQQLAVLPPDAKLLVDARHSRWSSPYGLTGLLTLAQSRPEPPQFIQPEDHETASYWARSGFFRHAEVHFRSDRPYPKASRTTDTGQLLMVTPIVKTEDVQQVVAHIEAGATLIMKTLGFKPSEAMGFSIVLSESCQNIIEHAGGPGWVAVQSYNWQKRLGRRVVVIAVSDGGLGFRRSLEQSPTLNVTDRWDDAAALEAAVLRATSRFRDPGRGQGLAGIRRYVGKWKAKFTVRSGTARIGLIPAWDDEKALVEHLPQFPGTQMQIIVPSLPESAE